MRRPPRVAPSTTYRQPRAAAGRPGRGAQRQRGDGRGREAEGREVASDERRLPPRLDVVRHSPARHRRLEHRFERRIETVQAGEQVDVALRRLQPADDVDAALDRGVMRGRLDPEDGQAPAHDLRRQRSDRPLARRDACTEPGTSRHQPSSIPYPRHDASTPVLPPPPMSIARRARRGRSVVARSGRLSIAARRHAIRPSPGPPRPSSPPRRSSRRGIASDRRATPRGWRRPERRRPARRDGGNEQRARLR